MFSTALPEKAFQRPAPPPESSPLPVESWASRMWVVSILEETIIVCRGLSHQRKAGMPSFEPSRMPAWLAEVWLEKSGSQPVSSMAAAGQPSPQRRHVTSRDRLPQDRLGKAVDLEEDESRLGAVGHVAELTPQRRGDEMVVSPLVVLREDGGQQRIADGQPQGDENACPEIGHFDAAEAELVIEASGDGDDDARQDEADDGEEPRPEADRDQVDDRPEERLRKRDGERRRNQRHRVLEAEAGDDLGQERQQQGLHDDHADDAADEPPEPQSFCLGLSNCALGHAVALILPSRRRKRTHGKA